MPPPETAPLTEIAHAKINLALHVRARRDDGYHELESVFAFAEDGDQLRAEPRSDGVIGLTIDGPFGGGLGTGVDNLVMQAALGLAVLSGRPRGAALHLTKNLPVASGIGGGSADAAAALRLLCRLWDISPAPEALHDLALSLGSDVPACLASRTLFVGGRGEQLETVTIDGLAGRPMLLVNPRVPLSTGPVFAGWNRVDRGALDVTDLATARNDLEPSAVALVPAIADVLTALRNQPGVTLARMSGSGATCFALFDDDAARDAAAAAMNPDWWTMASRIKAA
jgi:4-diphosphocytidyl-2-C-methyl-D-erythritol kinase